MSLAVVAAAAATATAISTTAGPLAGSGSGSDATMPPSSSPIQSPATSPSTPPPPFEEIPQLVLLPDDASTFPALSPPGSPPSEPVRAAPLRASKRFVYLPRRHLPLSARLLLRTLDTLQTVFLNVVGLTLVTLAAPLSLLIAVTPWHPAWDGIMLEVLQRSWDVLDVVEEGENVRIGDWIHRRWHTRQLALTASRPAQSTTKPTGDDTQAVELESLPALHKNDSGIDLQALNVQA